MEENEIITTEQKEQEEKQEENETYTKHCSKCGAYNKSDSKFCGLCGNKLEDNSVDNPSSLDSKSDSKGNTLAVISLALFFGGGILLTRFLGFFIGTKAFQYLSGLSGLMLLSGIVLMIYGRIKYPKNNALKAAMITMIIMIIIAIILFAMFLVMCNNCMNTLLSGQCD